MCFSTIISRSALDGVKTLFKDTSTISSVLTNLISMPMILMPNNNLLYLGLLFIWVFQDRPKPFKGVRSCKHFKEDGGYVAKIALEDRRTVH